jgi:DnaJ-class molecular chaperone
MHIKGIRCSNCSNKNSWNGEYFYKPSGKPYRCPLCDGEGTKVKVKPVDEPSQTWDNLIYGIPQTCNGCNGTGIVWG